MNFKNFLKIALAIGSAMSPAIALAEKAIEGIGKGEKKKEKVLELIMALPEITQLLGSNEIKDTELFKRGIGRVNDGLVDIMNSVK